MTNYNHKDVFRYFIVSDLSVKTYDGDKGNYALFDWERNFIDKWFGLCGDSVGWASSTLNHLKLPYHQLRLIDRTQWENELEK